MQRFLQTVALLGAFLVLCAGLWQGWSLLVTIKKMTVAYLGIFTLGALAALAFRAAGNETRDPGDKRKKGDNPAA